MSQIIGFATEFYTLWDHSVEPQYFTDAYGQHWHVRDKHIYRYIQNISTDLDKVKRLYPGVTIAEELRGMTRSWERSQDRQEDPCPHILKFGKHNGQDIAKIAETDFPYILWLLENASNPKLRELVARLPQVIAHIKKLNDHMEAQFAAIPRIESSGVVGILITANANPINNWDTDQKYSNAENGWEDLYAIPGTIQEGKVSEWGKGHSVVLILSEGAKLFSGNWRYPDYYLPIIGGSARRLKGKKIKFDIELLETRENKEYGWITQYARIKSLVVDKKVRKPKQAPVSDWAKES